MLLADTLVVIGLATVSLGTIHEEDGMQELSFWLRNDGQVSVVMLQGYTSCGCTTIDFVKNTNISPGDSTCVTLHFNPRGKGGEFEEMGTIVYGPSQKKVQMSMIGNCITSEETLMRQFPVRVSEDIRLSAERFDLGIMHVGETKERNIIILHRNENNRQERILLSFTPDGRTPKGLQHIVKPVETTDKGKRKTIKITLDVIIK